MMNRLWNVSNHHQGQSKRVLCVCSACLLRSPTIAWVLGNDPYNYNTRAAGINDEYALIPVDNVLVHWAQEIVCADRDHEMALLEKFKVKVPVLTLCIPDRYPYKDKELVEAIIELYGPPEEGK